ncbi:uncharacterized protein LOC121282107 isoform X3 [Carcharodon carcharias]|uniref:uncharacterized protein LOC121282107 isoform X2 n=1 Tax=Carcharodon carcharias TaxID=13397 RepID=UPI001B7DB866|nr:uncharacterized protein LOC121282107 isoform X2 [Carcharodon carcharias]XP_041051517.1 uncharacterized protein LOC121282107 isoform X3 [Carcharodon carcharias]
MCNEDEFDAVLSEFNIVMEDLSCSAKNGVQYEEYLNQMRKISAPSAADSGIDDSESMASSAGSSLSCSIEKLNSVGTTTSKVRLVCDLEQNLEAVMLSPSTCCPCSSSWQRLRIWEVLSKDPWSCCNASFSRLLL